MSNQTLVHVCVYHHSISVPEISRNTPKRLEFHIHCMICFSEMIWTQTFSVSLLLCCSVSSDCYCNNYIYSTSNKFIRWASFICSTWPSSIFCIRWLGASALYHCFSTIKSIRMNKTRDLVGACLWKHTETSKASSDKDSFREM